MTFCQDPCPTVYCVSHWHDMCSAVSRQGVCSNGDLHNLLTVTYEQKKQPTVRNVNYCPGMWPYFQGVYSIRAVWNLLEGFVVHSLLVWFVRGFLLFLTFISISGIRVAYIGTQNCTHSWPWWKWAIVWINKNVVLSSKWPLPSLVAG